MKVALADVLLSIFHENVNGGANQTTCQNSPWGGHGAMADRKKTGLLGKSRILKTTSPLGLCSTEITPRQ